MVRQMGHKLNAELLRWLREHPVTAARCRDNNEARTYRRTCWRLRDRLSDLDILRLIMARQRGIAMNELTERYEINVKSVRKLLREHIAKAPLD